MRFQRLSGRLLMSTTTNPVAGTEPVEPTATSLGPDENVLGAISYLFAPPDRQPVYLLEDDNEFARFHAAQSIVSESPR